MAKDCPSDKILNPLTGRCVKKTGNIGKSLLKSDKKVVVSPPKPKRRVLSPPKPKRRVLSPPKPKRKVVNYNKKRNYLNSSFRKFIDPNIPNLHFTDIETLYISNPRDCRWRNNWLFHHKDIYHICDAYACIGGDTIQFMKIKPKAKIDAVQLVDTSDELKERYERLKLNIRNCSFLNSKVRTYPLSIVDFIRAGKCKSTDFLYCDPPWADHKGVLYDCPTLMENLNNDIINPLNRKKTYPKYICFKVPFEWAQFNPILTNLKNYYLKNSGSFHWKVYWMHIIQFKLPTKI